MPYYTYINNMVNSIFNMIYIFFKVYSKLKIIPVMMKYIFTFLYYVNCCILYFHLVVIIFLYNNNNIHLCIAFICLT